MDIIKLADRYMHHEFNVLGSGWKRCFYGMSGNGFEGKNYFSQYSRKQAVDDIPEFYRKKAEHFISMLPDGYEPVDWQIDLRSGARFTASTHHSKIAYGVTDGVDAKVSADLGRLYQLPVLARAYRKSKKSCYKKEMLNQLYDFMAFNAPEYGAAWRANMNVAIRAANIIFALEIAGVKIKGELLDFISEHDKYIYNNLEYPENHYHPNLFISNLAALLMTSIVCRNRTHYDYAVENLDRQILWQSNAEGTNFENATSYHFFVLEMLATPIIYAAQKENMTPDQWIKTKFSAAAVERLEKICSTAAALCDETGHSPIIGDNDSGRFAILENPVAAAGNWNFLFKLCNQLFPDKKFSTGSSDSAAFPEAGYFILRQGQKNMLFFTCGPIGTNGKGGHAHNDKLAFTLRLDGRNIFTDPGIYIYTASSYYRKLFRSTSVHNTLQIKEYEQNRSGENPWWGMFDDTACVCTEFTENSVAGKHSGFLRFPDGAEHTRNIDWQGNTIKITDTISKKCDGVKLNFMLNEDVEMVEFSAQKIKLRSKNVLITMTSNQGKWHTEGAFIAHSYGTKTYTQKLVLEWENACDSSSVTINYTI